jgi:hypothetical protein
MQDALLVIVKDDFKVKFCNEKAKLMFNLDGFEMLDEESARDELKKYIFVQQGINP